MRDHVAAKIAARENGDDGDAMPDINNNDPFSNDGKGWRR